MGFGLEGGRQPLVPPEPFPFVKKRDVVPWRAVNVRGCSTQGLEVGTAFGSVRTIA